MSSPNSGGWAGQWAQRGDPRLTPSPQPWPDPWTLEGNCLGGQRPGRWLSQGHAGSSQPWNGQCCLPNTEEGGTETRIHHLCVCPSGLCLNLVSQHPGVLNQHQSLFSASPAFSPVGVGAAKSKAQTTPHCPYRCRKSAPVSGEGGSHYSTGIGPRPQRPQEQGWVTAHPERAGGRGGEGEDERLSKSKGKRLPWLTAAARALGRHGRASNWAAGLQSGADTF